jgi:hypothetical protein
MVKKLQNFFMPRTQLQKFSALRLPAPRVPNLNVDGIINCIAHFLYAFDFDIFFRIIVEKST